MSILKDSIQDHLTAAPIDRFARASHPGMAHFAGTGPAGRTCRECLFWDHGPYDYKSKNGKHRGLINPARCKKYQQITRQRGAEIPDNAEACRYFEANPTIPPRVQKS